MNAGRNLFNNELICALSIYFVLTHLKSISITKAILIFPFVSHKGTLDFLKSKSTKIRSLEEFIIKKPDYFSNYNERFYSFLTLSINSLILLKEMGLIIIDGSIIYINPDNEIEIYRDQIGERAFNIFQASSRLSTILSGDDKNLYLQLRVEI